MGRILIIVILAFSFNANAKGLSRIDRLMTDYKSKVAKYNKKPTYKNFLKHVVEKEDFETRRFLRRRYDNGALRGKLPKIKVNVKKRKISTGKHTLEVLNIEKRQFSLNGYKFSFKRNMKAEDRFAYVQRILRSKKSSSWWQILPKAHALFGIDNPGDLLNAFSNMTSRHAHVKEFDDGLAELNKNETKPFILQSFTCEPKDVDYFGGTRFKLVSKANNGKDVIFDLKTKPKKFNYSDTESHVEKPFLDCIGLTSMDQVVPGKTYPPTCTGTYRLKQAERANNGNRHVIHGKISCGAVSYQFPEHEVDNTSNRVTNNRVPYYTPEKRKSEGKYCINEKCVRNFENADYNSEYWDCMFAVKQAVERIKGQAPPVEEPKDGEEPKAPPAAPPFSPAMEKLAVASWECTDDVDDNETKDCCNELEKELKGTQGGGEPPSGSGTTTQ